MATTKKKKKQPRADTIRKQERHAFLAKLYRRGVPRHDVYRMMISKFKVTEQTVRRDICELGKSAEEYHGNKHVIRNEVAAAVERLKERARRDDSVGNRADELLLNIYGNRDAKTMRQNLEAQKLRLQIAQEQLTQEKTRLTKLQSIKAELEMSRNVEAQEEFRVLLDKISDGGQVGFGEIVTMPGLLLRRELESDAGPDVGRVTSFLNLLYRIAEANPPTDLSGQHFQIPENLFTAGDLDLGDDLMPQ